MKSSRILLILSLLLLSCATGASAGRIDTIAGPVRVSLASTTPVYAVGFATFSVSTVTLYGIIRARRVR